MKSCTPPPDSPSRRCAARPIFVGLSAAYLPRPDALERTIKELKEQRVPVLVGGPAFNRNLSLWTKLGADGHGSDVRVAVALARRIAAA